MSKNITIQEGGVGKNLSTIKKIQTAKQGGGSVLWVPEEEVQLGTKSINKNGTFKAEDDGLYGYSQVTVSGVGKTKGINPSTGNDSIAEVNPTTNEIELRDIPSRIDITTNPTKTEYLDGENIDITGIVVKAYYKDGSEWGTVPVSELSFEPTVAKYDGDASHTSDLVDGDVFGGVPPYYEHVPDGVKGWVREGGSVSYANIRPNSNDITRGVASAEPFQTTSYDVWADGSFHNISTSTAYSYTYMEKTVYYIAGTKIASIYPEVNAPINHVNAGGVLIAWTLIYGEVEGGGKQKVTVSWSNDDVSDLTDTFEITVTPSNIGGGSPSGDTEGDTSGGGTEPIITPHV